MLELRGCAFGCGRVAKLVMTSMYIDQFMALNEHIEQCFALCFRFYLVIFGIHK